MSILRYLSHECTHNLEQFCGLLNCHRKMWRMVAKNLNKIKDPVEGSPLIELKGYWPIREKDTFLTDMQIVPDFVSEEEEHNLYNEIEPYMNRLRYEFDHWDDAIHGYRETERKQWYPHNRKIIERICKTASICDAMPYVHILDLAREGIIKPHVDSTRYCGDTIAGLSLLSHCVMRMMRTNDKLFKQNPRTSTNNADPYREERNVNSSSTFYANILIPRRSLYIMCDSARYNFTHEILSNKEAIFKDTPVQKCRRISIICRNEP